MTKAESLALYNAGPKVVVKILYDLSRTIESQQNQIEALEIKIAKLSKNSSNSSKRPSSDDITKPKTQNPKGQEKGSRKIGGQPGHERHGRVPFTNSEIDKTHPYILSACPECNGEVNMLDMPPRIVQQMELVEVPIIKEEHRSYPVWCDKCQKIHYMPFPVNVVKEGLFKERLTAKKLFMNVTIWFRKHSPMPLRRLKKVSSP
jgi:transposase